MKLNSNIAALGLYVPGKTVPGAEKLSSNENPLGPSPLAVEAARAAVEQMHRYPDGASGKLKEALASLWNLDVSRVLTGNGSNEVFCLLCAAWMGPGQNAVSSHHTFSGYRRAVEIFGGRIKEAPMRRAAMADAPVTGAAMADAPVTDGRLSLEAMEELIDDDTSLIFICNPNNPTGTFLTHGELAGFLGRLRARLTDGQQASPAGGNAGVRTGGGAAGPGSVAHSRLPIVVLDEAYAEFADDERFPDSRALLEEFPNLVVTRTFSKLYGLAGLRAGYALGSETVIAGAGRAAMPFTVNAPAQAAAVAALSDSAYTEAYLALVREEKAFLYRELSARNLACYPSQANFICIDLGTPAQPLWKRFAEGGIALRNLQSFGLPSMVRYTIGRREHSLRLLSLLDGMLR